MFTQWTTPPVIKNNAVSPFMTMWKELEVILLGEINQKINIITGVSLIYGM